MLKYYPFHYQTFFCSFSFFNFPSLSLLYILVYIRIFQCEQAHFQLINSRLFYVKCGIYYKRLVYIINTWCEPRLTMFRNKFFIMHLGCIFQPQELESFFISRFCSLACQKVYPDSKINAK